jgi:hypothetical protein
MSLADPPFDPFVENLVTFPELKRRGWLTSSKERITLWRGLYNLKRWTARTNFEQLVRQFPEAAAARAAAEAELAGNADEASPTWPIVQVTVAEAGLAGIADETGPATPAVQVTEAPVDDDSDLL